MKKILTVLMAACMLVSCTATKPTQESTTTETSTASAQTLDSLKLQFVPSKDADVIITGTKNLDKLLIAALDKRGYKVNQVEISVGTSYEATGEALAAGTVDVGWLPGGTYALFSDETDVILTATRAGLSNDSEDAKTWNGDANATQKNGAPVTYYRSLIYATPSAYGKELAAKINAGESLTWEDLDKANWGVMKTSSSAGYIYPTLWLMKNYGGKKITDLSNVTVIEGGYGASFAQAAAESLDIIVAYADARNDYEASWKLPTGEQDATKKAGLGRNDSIWNEVQVIGVTEPIYNDTVAVTKARPEVYNPAFIAALQDSFIEIIGTEEGAKIFDVYSHKGYAKAVDADYEGAREALAAAQ